MPDFVVVGAAKAGTTSLHHYLRSHPGIHLPAREEPSWFAFDGERPAFRGPGGTWASVNERAVTDRATYTALYADAAPAQLRGDVSPVYLYWPRATERLRAEVPDARIVAILRQPVDRAYSAFMHAKREGKEPLGFEEALAAEPARIAEGWGFLWRYADLGRYAAQVSRLLGRFPRDQVLVLTFDELTRDPTAFVRRVAGFVGADADFEADTDVRYNVSGVPRSRLAWAATATDGPLRPLAKVLRPVLGVHRLRKIQARLRSRVVDRPELDPGLRARLTEGFRADIERTAALTGLDLGHWV